MQNSETLWTFKTARFTFEWIVSDSYDLDLSWDESGETLEKLQSGELVSFDSEMRVSYMGETIFSDYLGGSIYENPADFRDHIGCKPAPIMKKASKALRGRMKQFSARASYALEKLQSGEWSKAHYMRSTRDDREALRAARVEFSHHMAMARRGGYGSYFADMMAECIAAARAHIDSIATVQAEAMQEARSDMCPDNHY